MSDVLAKLSWVTDAGNQHEVFGKRTSLELMLEAITFYAGNRDVKISQESALTKPKKSV